MTEIRKAVCNIKTAENKRQLLYESLENLQSVAVAFSGGVDSAFLLEAAHTVLGERAVAVTSRSYLFPEREFWEAERFCQERGIRQIVILSEELKIEGFSANPANRCYLCKRELFRKMLETAENLGLSVVVEGSNVDDMGDYRPGMQAVAELGVISPLRDAGLTKAEIRYLSRQAGLPVWNKPSFACLASRFVYGETITQEKLSMVERAEELLRDLGFYQYRVRVHGTLARIEILPGEFERLLQEGIRKKVATKLREYGFSYVSLDVEGYRTGSMNEKKILSSDGYASERYAERE